MGEAGGGDVVVGGVEQAEGRLGRDGRDVVHVGQQPRFGDQSPGAVVGPGGDLIAAGLLQIGPHAAGGASEAGAALGGDDHLAALGTLVQAREDGRPSGPIREVAHPGLCLRIVGGHDNDIGLRYQRRQVHILVARGVDTHPGRGVDRQHDLGGRECLAQPHIGHPIGAPAHVDGLDLVRIHDREGAHRRCVQAPRPCRSRQIRRRQSAHSDQPTTATESPRCGRTGPPPVTPTAAAPPLPPPPANPPAPPARLRTHHAARFRGTI